MSLYALLLNIISQETNRCKFCITTETTACTFLQDTKNKFLFVIDFISLVMVLTAYMKQEDKLQTGFTITQ